LYIKEDVHYKFISSHLVISQLVTGIFFSVDINSILYLQSGKAKSAKLLKVSEKAARDLLARND